MVKVKTNKQDLITYLVEDVVEVSIGEPWDFGRGKERNPFDAIIDKVSIRFLSQGKKVKVQESILIRIVKPFPYNNCKCEFFLGTPRHVGIGLEQLFLGDSVSFNFLRIPKDLASSNEPFQRDIVQNGKNYFGLIGSLKKR
jgi:hypothetical protein